MGLKRMNKWNNHINIDDIIGIERYATKGEGIGGVLRCRVEDFVVEEVTSRVEGESGDYLIVEVEKRNWDTHKLIRDLSRRLRVSQSRFGWAGTKDKRALTKQRLSIWKVGEEELSRIHMRDVCLRVLGRSNRKISLGDLYANRFHVTVRGVCLSLEEVVSRIERISGELLEIGGVPNFFGVQRFGELRPVTHVVGRALVEGDVERAVITYLATVHPGEPVEQQEARQYFADTRDAKGSLRLFPESLIFERAMLHHLVEHPGDYAGALGRLSGNLQRMFVHAYQSYLFNRVLSRRLALGLPLNRAVVGDIVCFRNQAGLPDVHRVQRVDEQNLEGINRLMQRQRAFVTAPLFGYDMPLASGVPGEIEREVLGEEGVGLEDFRVGVMPAYASKGLRREVLMGVNPEYRVMPDEVHEGCCAVLFEFTLQKGGYATVLLREYMKV